MDCLNYDYLSLKMINKIIPSKSLKALFDTEILFWNSMHWKLGFDYPVLCCIIISKIDSI